MGGGECQIDDKDFEWMAKLKWKLRKDGYIQLSQYNLLHRIVLLAPKGLHVHHKNEDKLDNRSVNLELITNSDHGKHHAHRLVAYQKAHQKYPDVKKCVVCPATFQVNPRKRKRNKCCSLGCRQVLQIEGRQRQARKLRLKS